MLDYVLAWGTGYLEVVRQTAETPELEKGNVSHKTPSHDTNVSAFEMKCCRVNLEFIELQGRPGNGGETASVALSEGSSLIDMANLVFKSKCKNSRTDRFLC